MDEGIGPAGDTSEASLNSLILSTPSLKIVLWLESALFSTSLIYPGNNGFI